MNKILKKVQEKRTEWYYQIIHVSKVRAEYPVGHADTLPELFKVLKSRKVKFDKSHITRELKKPKGFNDQYKRVTAKIDSEYMIQYTPLEYTD